MSVRVTVQTRNHDGTLGNVETWGNVMSIDYDAATEILTVCGGDATAGVRQKMYLCGLYAGVSVFVGGPTDYDAFPPDAKKVI